MPASPLQWSTGDWDPALRFWALPFDSQLTQWLHAVDPSRPSVQAAREFAAQHAVWDVDEPGLLAGNWLEPDDLKWQPGGWVKDGGGNWVQGAAADSGWPFIRGELEQLRQLMEDDRDRYLAESEAQADGLPGYMLAFIGASQARHPWTVELVSCGLAIVDVAAMRWKSRFKRVRPSTLSPGLLPPMGPPAHPAFPSGHATAAYLIALLLLQIPGLRHRHGVFDASDGTRAKPIDYGGVAANPLPGTQPLRSPLLWLAARLAKNRERLGVHFGSDSSAGRHLAAGLGRALLHETSSTGGWQLDCPTLRMVLSRAAAEWPTPWPA